MPSWISELTDKEVFYLYKLEDAGLITTKIEHKEGNRYERRIYFTKEADG